jgi:hypothetical protein
MTMFLGIHDAEASLAAVVGDEGTPEEQEFVARLRAEGLMHDPADGEDRHGADGDERDGLDLVLAAREGGATALDLALLESVPASSMGSEHDRIAYLKRCDRVIARGQSLRAEALVSLAGAEPSGAYLTEVHVEHEIAVATRSSAYASGKAIETARTLATTFPAFAEALAAGEIAQGHCTVLVDRTRVVVDPEALASIERVGIVRARRMTVGQFAHELSALIARFDPDAEARVNRARAQRRVTARRLDDGLGFLGLVHDWSVVSAVMTQVSGDAKVMQAQRRAETAEASARDDAATTGALGADADDLARSAGLDAATDVARWDDDDARLDACRADALAARVLGDVARSDDAADGSVVLERDPSSGLEVQLVIDLATLRGEAENPCLLDGAPVPAAVGRELASYAKAWRRMVTDPVDGHLIDYGTLTYLPRPLRDYVGARDGGCRGPVCGVRDPRRLQMDHAEEFPRGPSTPRNTGMLCTTEHQLKTAGLVDLVDTDDDGSATWVTAWGQSVWIPLRSFLPYVDPPPPPPEPIPF